MHFQARKAVQVAHSSRRRDTVSGLVVTLLAAAALLVGAGAGRPAWAGAQDWNDQQIRWRPYKEGLAEAKKSGKPVCLVFYTTWCPHCSNYARVFRDPGIVEKSKSFVMVRVDKDQQPDVSRLYRPDGEYIPRTYFLAPDGKVDESLTENRPQYKYFYDERNPAGLLAGMDRALTKLSRR